MPIEEIYSLAEDYTGLGDTGETVLASLRGEKVVLVAPTRHDPAAAFTDFAAIVREARRNSEKQGHPVRTRGIGMLGDSVRPNLIKENIR